MKFKIEKQQRKLLKQRAGSLKKSINFTNFSQGWQRKIEAINWQHQKKKRYYYKTC